MKIAPIFIALLVVGVTAWAVEGTVDYLHARSTGSSVVLDWHSGNEGNLEHYEVERAADDQVFRFVASISAKGSNQSYTFTDDEAFGKGDNQKVASNYFTYRLKLVHTDQSTSYSTSAGVSHSVSSIKRTWGMIKEMFR